MNYCVDYFAFFFLHNSTSCATFSDYSSRSYNLREKKTWLMTIEACGIVSNGSLKDSECLMKSLLIGDLFVVMRLIINSSKQPEASPTVPDNTSQVKYSINRFQRSSSLLFFSAFQHILTRTFFFVSV